MASAVARACGVVLVLVCRALAVCNAGDVQRWRGAGVLWGGVYCGAVEHCGSLNCGG